MYSNNNNNNTNNSTCNLHFVLSNEKLNVERFTVSEKDIRVILITIKVNNDFHMQGKVATTQDIHEMLTQTKQNIPNKSG